MAVYPKFIGFEILKNIEKRLFDKDCPLYEYRNHVMDYLFGINCSYTYDFQPSNNFVLDSFMSEDGKYDIYICESRINEGYLFYYKESEKYKLLSKMED